MSCPYTHTKFQPGNGPEDQKNWFCPHCGAGYEVKRPGQPDAQGFIIASSVNEEEPEGSDAANCQLIHNDDELVCYQCDYTASGAVAMRAITKKLSLVPCSTCKGRGMVPRTQPEEQTSRAGRVEHFSSDVSG